MSDYREQIESHEMKLMELELALASLHQELLAQQRDNAHLRQALEQLRLRFEASREVPGPADHDTAAPPHY